MAKKVKFYIPLTGKGGVTYIRIDNMTEILNIMPSIDDILWNKTNQDYRVQNFLDYKFQPLQRKVTSEHFNKLEIEIRKKKPGHAFFRKSFDIVSNSDFELPLVQIYQV